MKPVKYQDKSIGQPEMSAIFDTLKSLMLPYDGRGTVFGSAKSGGEYHLWSKKPIEVVGRKMDAICLASIMVQKGYVGFYYMPIYCFPSLREKLSPHFIKNLKGKSCFHIKKIDEDTLQQISFAMELGYNEYEKKGWV